MKRPHYIVLFLLPIVFGFKIGEKIKPFELRDIDGNIVYMKNFCGENPKAKVIILDFFSTKCAPCIKALDALKKVRDDYKGVVVFLVSFQEKERSLRNFFGEKEKPFTILMDKYGDTARNFGVIGLPHTIILDRGCVWREQIIGEMEEHEKVLREKVERVLGVRR